MPAARCLAGCTLALVAALLTFNVTCPSVHASGCDPPPHRLWPYRVVLDVAPTAKPGETLTYRLDYGLVDKNSQERFGFVLAWTGDASFESARAISGPQGVRFFQWQPDRVWWEFNARPQSGAMEIVLKIGDGFSGDIGASVIYHRPGRPPSGSYSFQWTNVSENPPERNRQFAWMQHKVVITGPSVAHSGDAVTYNIAYERVRPDGVPLSLTFEWPPDAVSSVVAGSSPPDEEQAAFGAMDLSVDGSADSGSIDIKIKIRPDFVGCLSVGWYVRGTGIMSQIGSVEYLQTEVRPPT